mmetsp:Transcript_12326/g.22994  ORF Transcript_12326/g.22994 Transcript_12326/m.22994 type:complete len:83 (+) Transcript_12326:1411-1659(+)
MSEQMNQLSIKMATSPFLHRNSHQLHTTHTCWRSNSWRKIIFEGSFYIHYINNVYYVLILVVVLKRSSVYVSSIFLIFFSPS